MNTHPIRRCLAAALLAASGTCWATLGEPMAAPAGATSESAQSPGGARYTVLASRLDSGTEVREYANAQGIVFAVSWSGPFLPDLRSLLGSSFAALEQHAAGAGRASAVSIQTPELTLLSGGRMGAFPGRAWLPRHLPPGLDPRARG